VIERGRILNLFQPGLESTELSPGGESGEGDGTRMPARPVSIRGKRRSRSALHSRCGSEIKEVTGEASGGGIKVVLSCDLYKESRN